MPIYIEFPSGGVAMGLYPDEIKEKKVMLDDNDIFVHYDSDE